MSNKKQITDTTCSASCACGQFGNCYQSSKYLGADACSTLVNNGSTLIAATYMPGDGSGKIGKKMSCTNTDGDPTNGCCWWGRGPINVTGPQNYGAIQKFLTANNNKIGTIQFTPNQLCGNPELICTNPDYTWISSMHYWMTVVQMEPKYLTALSAYVAGCATTCVLDLATLKSASTVSFPAGVSAAINQGDWSKVTQTDGIDNRLNNFIAIMKQLSTQVTYPLTAPIITGSIKEVYNAAGLTSLQEIAKTMGFSSTVADVFKITDLWTVLENYQNVCQAGGAPTTNEQALSCSFWYWTTNNFTKPTGDLDYRYGVVAVAAFLANMGQETGNFVTCDETDWGNNCTFCTEKSKDSPCPAPAQTSGYCGWQNYGSYAACTPTDCAGQKCNAASDAASNVSKSACGGGWCPNGYCGFQNYGSYAACTPADCAQGKCTPAKDAASNASADVCTASGGGWCTLGYCGFDGAGKACSSGDCAAGACTLAKDAASNASAAICITSGGGWCAKPAFCGWQNYGSYAACSPGDCRAGKCNPAKDALSNSSSTECDKTGGGWCGH